MYRVEISNLHEQTANKGPFTAMCKNMRRVFRQKTLVEFTHTVYQVKTNPVVRGTSIKY